MYLRAPTAESGPALLAGKNVDGSSVSWLEFNWPFLACHIFLVGTVYLVTTFSYRNHFWLGCLLIVLYCLHQMEEHAYDLRGWRYSFAPNAAYLFGEVSGNACQSYASPCPLDPKMLLYINMGVLGAGFGGCLLMATLNPRRFGLSTSLNWGAATFNGLFGHIIPAIVHGRYNPGVAQSFIMVPIGFYIISHFKWPLLSLAWGLVVHVVLASCMAAVFIYDVSEELPMMLLVISSLVLPLLLSSIFSEGAVKKRIN